MENENPIIYPENANLDNILQRPGIKDTKGLSGLNNEQRTIYNSIMEAVFSKSGGMFFVYGHGGTGKTYLYRTILAAIRSKGKIALAVASSGIAALLLPGGRTVHSRFHIPINVNDESTCEIKQKNTNSRTSFENKYNTLG